MRRVVAPLAVGLLALACGLPARADEGSPPPPTDVQASLEALAAPGERTRRRAVLHLIDALPASRAPVIEALSEASRDVKLHLVEVLAADASPDAIRALLVTMNRGEELLAVRIRRVLVADETATRRVLEAWATDPSLREDGDGDVSDRTLVLERLLRRAEAERIFLSRKSRTGSTGSYRGQYDLLKPFRAEAMDLAVAILTDRAIPEPGVFPAGEFTFLRPSPVYVDMNELKGMAAHALAELGQPGDMRHLFTLHRHLAETLKPQVDRGARWDAVAFTDVLAAYADLLVALHQVYPERYAGLLERFLDRLERDGQWSYFLGSTYRPIVLLRIGRYPEAVEYLERALAEGPQSIAGTHYNLACAYSQWAVHTPPGVVHDAMLSKAMRHLEHAVNERWSDIGWMEEDRDLEPLRSLRRYQTLVARVRADLGLPPAPAHPESDGEDDSVPPR